MADFDFNCEICSKVFCLRLFAFHQHLVGHILYSIKKLDTKLFCKVCKQLFSDQLKPVDKNFFHDMQVYKKLNKVKNDVKKRKFHRVLMKYRKVVEHVSGIEILSSSDSNDDDIMEGLDPQQQRVASEVFGTSSNAVPVDNVILDQISPTHQDLFDCLNSIRQSCIDRRFPCIDG